MLFFEKKVVERLVVSEVECECCGRVYPPCSYNERSVRGAGFSKIYGEDEAGFGTHKYTEHACSLECTLTLVRKHMAPVVEFPYIWAKDRKENAPPSAEPRGESVGV